MLDDEEFPGMIFARIKLFTGDIEEELPKFQPRDLYQDYILQVHLYIGRDFPPADTTGAADPFIVARC